MVSITRTPAQLKERWENTLKKTFKKYNHSLKVKKTTLKLTEIRGNWSLQDDMFILNFAEINGTKWAQISRYLSDRTEHNVKNRFFALISEFLQLPIKKVKKKIDYANRELIRNTMTFFLGKNGN